MIGIFDSGIGGLSIYKDIKTLFPKAKIIYLADKKNFPYGEKTEEELFDICDNNIRILTNHGAKVVVIACNSATVSNITKLREKWQISIIGVEPAVKVAANNSKKNKIGLIATKRTIYDHKSEGLLDGDQILVKSHKTELVDMIENNPEKITDIYLKESIDDVVSQGVDSIVLGCTHYHFVKDRLEALFPEIVFYAPGEAVAKRTVEIIDQNDFAIEEGDDVFLVTRDLSSFKKSFVLLFGSEAGDVREV